MYDIGDKVIFSNELLKEVDRNYFVENFNTFVNKYRTSIMTITNVHILSNYYYLDVDPDGQWELEDDELTKIPETKFPEELFEL